MEAFSSIPPTWTESAVHSLSFSCPTCQSPSGSSKAVWINRRAPVYTYSHKRKWQEFYHCDCGVAWWGWSTDRPPNPWEQDDDDEGSDPA